MSTEEKLIKETKKWLRKAKKKRKKIKTCKNKDFLKNIDAYISDTNHFLENGEYIEAFEAIVWAWSWMEILEELKYIE